MALTGLGLAYALPMVSLLNSLLTSAAETEQELVSVERTLQFTQLPQARTQTPVHEHDNEAAECAPTLPTLILDRVTLTYPGRDQPALSDVSLHVEAGQHVGICGRTGAGKSSLLNAIFQLTAIQSGTVSVGGVDLANVSRKCALFTNSLQHPRPAPTRDVLDRSAGTMPRDSIFDTQEAAPPGISSAAAAGTVRGVARNQPRPQRNPARCAPDQRAARRAALARTRRASRAPRLAQQAPERACWGAAGGRR